MAGLNRFHRHTGFEALEDRHLLSITLPNLAVDQTVLAGAPLNLGLDSFESSGHALSYTVAVSNSTLTGGDLNASIPTGNPSLQLTVSDTADGINGTMTFQLFQDLSPRTVQQIMSLVNADFYDDLTFHRIIENFMIQGGDPDGDGSGGPDQRFDDEFNPALQFTGSGLLAMANSGCDTNGSQFFITTDAFRHGDFRYTIFGILTEGQDILAAIEGVGTDDNDKPDNNIVITDASMINDIQNGVLRLSAPIGASGTADVTITVTDLVTNETKDLTFHITVGADTNDNRPILGNISPIQTNANTPVTFYIPATDLEGNAMYYGGLVSPANSDLSIDVDSSTGRVTITPTNNLSGVFSIEVGVRAADTPSDDSVAWDTQFIPVYINPAAPTSIDLTIASDTGGSSTDQVTNLNNTSGNTLQFQISGAVSGALVQLFSDGTLIGETTASGTTVTITTNATATLTDGTHQITASQTLQDQTVDVHNFQTTVDLASAPSTYLDITVDTTLPAFDFTPIVSATEDVAYSCLATATDDSGSLAYQLDQSPTGMTINAATGLISWTPTTGQLGPHEIVVRATDPAGNTTDRHYTLTASPVNSAPVLTPASPTLNANEDTPLTVLLAGTFINNGDGTTGIEDVDADATIGGIALMGFTGNGTLEYSLDGTTFVEVGSVSNFSAILLPKTATLRYTPDGQNGEAASITYRAWDTSTGTDGSRVDLSVSGATGDSTAFSTATDTALLDVADVNDAPVLVAAGPSLTSTSAAAAIVFSLNDSFINYGADTTGIDDVDAGAAIGGIALTGTTGDGTWEYSLDGTTYLPLGTISETSALLLPKTATLRYTPTGNDSGTATITYRAWDTSTGSDGDQVDTTVNGDTTAFSTDIDTATLWVNDSPELTSNDPSLGTTDEDTAIAFSLDTFMNNGAGSTAVADFNQNDTLGGIALIGMTGDGSWQYSLDGGTTFIDIASVDPASSLLLPNDAILRYTSNHQDAETATIVYRAWDATTGTAGSCVDLIEGDVGGTTAFSAGVDTASLTVTGVNDAPVLTAANPVMDTSLPSIATVISLADTFINHGTGTTTIADVDEGDDYVGIALVGTTGNGTWEYSLDGGTTYVAFGSVSESSALLLPTDAQLRFTPSGTDSQDATITYHAWDATTGTAGELVDLSVSDTTGETTAFSTAIDTASLVINNAPVLVAATPSLGTTDEDTVTTFDLSAFIGGATGKTDITDANPSDAVGGIAIVGITGNGTWQYSLDGGTTFVTITSISDSSSLLLPADAKLRYTPDNQNGETPTITYRAWDGATGTAGGRADLSATEATGEATAFSTATDIASLAVVGVNDAPTLVAADPSLGSTTIYNAKIISLANAFVGTTSGLTQIIDVDQGAEYAGIALTGVTGGGLWEYSLDGTNYTNIGVISDTEALLLPKTAKLRYTPSGTDDETATITYRGWDTTTGTSGDKVDTSTNGDATAFSTDTDTASLSVVNPNTAPVLTAANPSLGNTNPTTTKTTNLVGTFINNGTGTTTIVDTDASAVTGGIAIVGVTGSGTWSYSLDGTSYTDIDTVSDASALLLPKTAVLRYTPDGSTQETATVIYRAWDTTTGVNGTKVDTTTNGSGTAFSTATDTASLIVTSASLSGFVYVDCNNDGLRLLPGGSAPLGIQGVVVTLLQQSGSTWTTMATTMTAANGSYQFDGLLPGTYKITEAQPTLFLDGKETLGKIDGAIEGTAGADQFVVEITAGQPGEEYNFGERGLAPQAISMRMCLASSPSAAEYVAQFYATSVVSLSNSSAGCGYTTIQAAGSTAIPITPAAATIHDVDNSALAWMTATLIDPLDGSSEILAAVTSGTPLVASYANHVLTISGIASVDVYEQVLKTITFRNNASSPTGGSRTIKVVTNDGLLSSQPDLTLTQSLAAIDAVLARTAHWR